MPIYEIPVIAAEWQDLDVVLNNVDCQITLKYSRIADRWSMDLTIEGEIRLQGRKLIPENDLIAGYDFGIGQLKLIDWEGRGTEPGFEELTSGQFRLVNVVE